MARAKGARVLLEAREARATQRAPWSQLARAVRQNSGLLATHLLRQHPAVCRAVAVSTGPAISTRRHARSGRAGRCGRVIGRAPPNAKEPRVSLTRLCPPSRIPPSPNDRRQHGLAIRPAVGFSQPRAIASWLRTLTTFPPPWLLAHRRWRLRIISRRGRTRAPLARTCRSQCPLSSPQVRGQLAAMTLWRFSKRSCIAMA